MRYSGENRGRGRRFGWALWSAVLAGVVWTATATAQPGVYQGFGASTPGGANGATVAVTNLNDSGPGSLREAISQGNRTVVFQVGGEIRLTDYLYVGGPFVTIDGFTAPSPITLRNRGLIIRGNRGAHDVIVRGIRVRTSAIDGIQVAYGAYNVVIDHVSVAGSLDGNIDITYDSHDVTVSWSVLGGNEKNMLVKYNPSRISLHHNVFTHGHTRNPQVRIDDAGGVATQITADIRNNVIANWTNGYGTLIWVGAWANVVNNYYTASNKAIQVLSARAHVVGNLSANGVDLNTSGNETSPFPTASVLTQDACTAARQVLSGAGVRPLDSVDQQYLAAIAVPSCPGSAASEDGRVQADVALGEDDAREYVTGIVRTNEGYLSVGRGNLVALRFSQVNVPQGAVIQSAVVELYGVASTAGRVSLRYAAEDAGDSAPFEPVHWALSTRARTHAFVDDVPDSWSTGMFNASPDLRALVQEVVERTDWGPGNSLTIFIEDSESVETRRVGSIEMAPSPSRAARLTIDYLVP